MLVRRAFVQTIAGTTLAFARPLSAQLATGRVARIGILIAESASGQSDRLSALREGLAELGYHEGQNLTLEIRSAEGHYDRLPLLAAELVRSRVDVLVAFGIKALTAARSVTAQIPLVIPATSSDLVAMKLIRSLARPGGNITGSTTFGSEVMAERLEIARELMPRITRVAVLINPANAGLGPLLQRMEGAARILKLKLQPFEIRAPAQFGAVFASIDKAGMEAVVVQDDTLFAVHANQLAELALRYLLPSIGGQGLVEAGVLAGYGRNEAVLYRRSAHYVDRILKGAAPGEIPIEQATRFVLWLNRKTAQALGIRFPEALWARADSIVQ